MSPPAPPVHSLYATRPVKVQAMTVPAKDDMLAWGGFAVWLALHAPAEAAWEVSEGGSAVRFVDHTGVPMRAHTGEVVCIFADGRGLTGYSAEDFAAEFVHVAGPKL